MHESKHTHKNNLIVFHTVTNQEHFSMFLQKQQHTEEEKIKKDIIKYVIPVRHYLIWCKKLFNVGKRKNGEREGLSKGKNKNKNNKGSKAKK